MKTGAGCVSPAPYKVLSLFAGIGGFDLGLERTGGFKTVAFCEIDKKAQAVLRKHWPEVPIYDDVRTLTAEQLSADGIAADVICGGFPCQDISIAGRRAGLSGDRSGLWIEVARLARSLRPRFLLMENVAAMLGNGMGDVLGDVAALGYNADWHCIPAAYVGAPHDRDRIWLVAYPDSIGNVVFSADTVRSGRDALEYGARWKAPPTLPRVDDGLSRSVDRNPILGNAVVPQIPELIGRAILAAEGRA